MKSRLLLIVSLVCLAFQAKAQEPCGSRGNCCNYLLDANCVEPQYNHHRLALVVGVNSYGPILENYLDPLMNAVNDAVFIGDQLDRAGFSVRYLLEPNKERFETEIRWFGNALGDFTDRMQNEPIGVRDEQLAVIYIAGHGFAEQGENNEFSEKIILREQSYQNPPDACRAYKDSASTSRFLRNTLSNYPHYPTVTLIDACRSLPSQLPDCGSTGQPRGASGMNANRLDSEFSVRLHSTQYSTQKLAPAQDTSLVDGLGAYASQIGPLLNMPGLGMEDVIMLSRRLVPPITQDLQVPSPVHNSDVHLEPFISPTPDASACRNLEGELWLKARFCTKLGETCEKERICPAYFEQQEQVDTASCDYRTFATMINRAAGRAPSLTMSDICRPFDLRTTAAANASFHFRAHAPSMSEILLSFEDPESDDPTTEALTQAAQIAEFTAIGTLTSHSIEAAGLEVLSVNRNRAAYELPESLDFQELGTAPTAYYRPQPRPGSGNVTTLGSDIQRQVLLARDFVPDIGLPVEATDAFRFYVAPNAALGQVLNLRALPQKASIRQDCVNVACGNGWIGATIKTGDEYYRGFVRPDMLVASEPTEELEVQMETLRSLRSDEREELNSLIDDAINSNGFMQVLLLRGMTGEPSPHDNSPLAANERLSIATIEKYILSRRAYGKTLRPENLSLQVVFERDSKQKLIFSIRKP